MGSGSNVTTHLRKWGLWEIDTRWNKQGNSKNVSLGNQDWWNQYRKQNKQEKEKSKVKVGFPGGSMVMNPPANAGDTGSIPGLRRSPGVGNGNSLQYSCLGNSMDREAWWATVHGMAKNQTQLSKWAHTQDIWFKLHPFHCYFRPVTIRRFKTTHVAYIIFL